MWQDWRIIKFKIEQITRPLRSSRLFSTTTILWLSTFAPGQGWADTDSSSVKPLYNSNQSPLVQIYGLPSLGEASVLGPEESTMAIHLQIANHFTGASTSSESLSLDGETQRLTLSWRHGLAGGTEWGFDLPYVLQNGGMLDMVIEEFHDIFNMPQNGRTELSRNRVDYRYTRNGVDLVNFSRSADGPGDIRLTAAKQAVPASSGSGYTAAWRISLKLPTGDEDKLLGSGSTDLAAWLSLATTRRADKWNLYGGGGVLLMNRGNVLPDQQRHAVLFGSVGISQKFFHKYVINAQMDVHSPFYDGTGLRQMGEYSAQGLLGVILKFAPRKYLEFSVSEDFLVGASPDVAFNVSLTVPF